MAIIHTYPIGSTSGLVINSVAFMGEKGGVPVAIVCLIVTNGKGLCRLEAVCRKLRREVVLRVQHGSVLEVNRHRVTLQDLCCLLGPPRALFLNHYLIDTKKKKAERSIHDTSRSPNRSTWSSIARNLGTSGTKNMAALAQCSSLAVPHAK